jgi:hypothetical protein
MPNIVESFRKIAKEETANFFFRENLRSNCKVLIVDGQWNVLAKTSIGICILDCFQKDHCKHAYKLFVPFICLSLLKISGDNWRVEMGQPF